MKNIHIQLVFLFFIACGCNAYQAKQHDFPKSIDTTTMPITLQEKKVYSIPQEGVFADNLFDGARLNDFKFDDGNRFRAIISPENSPINHSAYYAFRVWTSAPKKIQIELDYTLHKHRYAPKISRDGVHWELLDSNKVQIADDEINAILTLDIGNDTLWVAAQEIQNSTHVKQWCDVQESHSGVHLSSIGKSKLGRELWVLDMYNGNPKHKDVILIMCRQHPPEVTGYFAMQAFVDEIMAENLLSIGFRNKYRILIFPLMNPDGVDLGHWRHNAGGIDPNRDWAYYHQPENRLIANYIVRTVKKNKAKVVFGLDFHSTFSDVYYTNQDQPKYIPDFKDYWLWSVSEALEEPLNEKSSNVGSPVSKGWIYKQFNALGITYEIGDDTPREFIHEKGKTSAREMMKLLIIR